MKQRKYDKELREKVAKDIIEDAIIKVLKKEHPNIIKIIRRSVITDIDEKMLMYTEGLMLHKRDAKKQPHYDCYYCRKYKEWIRVLTYFSKELVQKDLRELK